jgi:succinyl-CoA synthetase beta subunit
MELDDAAFFRHPEWDFEDKLTDTNFVTLDPQGTIATIANGAGLAMATVDAVASAGMAPANFLDIGGGANTASVLAAFERIMEFTTIDAIVINIFAGITRCDEVAKAIIAAKQHIKDLPPLFIRLAGKNFEEAAELLAAEDILILPTLEECLAAAKGINHG